MILELLLVFLIFVLARLVYSSTSKSSKLPPGPRLPIPVLGHLPHLGDQPARTLLDWKSKYGPLISVQIGSFPAIVINDASLIKAAFNSPVFAGRPVLKLLDDYSRNRKGFMFSDGPHGQEQRQFIKRNLKDFGYGSQSMESVITDQISQLLQKLDENTKSPLAVKHLFNGYTINTLWNIVTGDMVDNKDTKITELSHYVTMCAAFPGVITKLMVFIPKLAVLFPNWSGYNEKMKYINKIQQFLQEKVDDVRANRVPGQPRVVLDAYLDKVDETADIHSSFHPKNFHDNLTISTQDLFGAGVETTSSTLEWTFYFLAAFPEIQEKLQEEIDRVIGSSRLPTAADKLRMPYTEAVINEILRFSTMVPLALYHRTLEKVEFSGYQIPKDTMILGNLYAVHHDPEVWGDPEAFRPERFLNNEGSIKKIPEFMPFSTGKKNCIGENLARLQLFIFTVSIYQRFKISSTGTLPSTVGQFGLTVPPDAFDVMIQRRVGN